MPFEKYYDETPQATGTPCVMLRSKAIYMVGNLKNPDHPDEVNSQYCWCNQTQHVIGPDQQHVNRHACIAGRVCFRDSH